MPVITGFDKLDSVPEEQITDKIGRRFISGKQGTMVYWRMKAGAHAAAHQHPQEQFVWLMRGAIRLRIGAEERTIKPGDLAVERSSTISRIARWTRCARLSAAPYRAGSHR